LFSKPLCARGGRVFASNGQVTNPSGPLPTDRQMASNLPGCYIGMIDKESARAVAGWLRLADRVAGVRPVEGRCDRCAGVGYVSQAGEERLCAACYLDGEAAAS